MLGFYVRDLGFHLRDTAHQLRLLCFESSPRVGLVLQLCNKLIIQLLQVALWVVRCFLGANLALDGGSWCLWFNVVVLSVSDKTIAGASWCESWKFHTSFIRTILLIFDLELIHDRFGHGNFTTRHGALDRWTLFLFLCGRRRTRRLPKQQQPGRRRHPLSLAHSTAPSVVVV